MKTDKDGQFGPIAIACGADPARKVVILSFSTKVDRVEFTAEQARDFAKTVVGRSFIADGTMPGEKRVAPPMAIAGPTGLGPDQANET